MSAVRTGSTAAGTQGQATAGCRSAGGAGCCGSRPAGWCGYTFTELLIVLVLIGYIGTQAIPAYQNYTTRARVAEAFTLVGPAQRAVARYYASKGRFPPNYRAAGLPPPDVRLGKHIAGIALADGAADVELVDISSLDGAVISFRPAVTDTGTGSAVVIWLCGFAAPPEGAVAVGENNTTVERRHLPASCRE